jgi:hypothetical protein
VLGKGFESIEKKGLKINGTILIRVRIRNQWDRSRIRVLVGFILPQSYTSI